MDYERQFIGVTCFYLDYNLPREWIVFTLGYRNCSKVNTLNFDGRILFGGPTFFLFCAHTLFVLCALHTGPTWHFVLRCRSRRHKIQSNHLHITCTALCVGNYICNSNEANLPCPYTFLRVWWCVFVMTASRRFQHLSKRLLLLPWAQHILLVLTYLHNPYRTPHLHQPLIVADRALQAALHCVVGR